MRFRFRVVAGLKILDLFPDSKEVERMAKVRAINLLLIGPDNADIYNRDKSPVSIEREYASSAKRVRHPCDENVTLLQVRAP